jgi:two-component system chemotaxis sensor kinase CheA
MSDYSDEVSADLELLDSLERKFLDLDRALDSGGVDRDAIHSLFRNAHNLKSAAATRCDEGAARLVHCIETSLDAMRSARIEPTRELVDTFLAGTDRLRERLAGGSPTDECDDIELIEAVGAIEKASERAATDAGVACLGFALSSEEESALERELALGARVYLTEKLLDGALGAKEVATLPIFDAIGGCGRVIAVRPERCEAPRGRESALRILFASELTPDDLFFMVFDPIRELKFPRGDERKGIGEILVSKPSAKTGRCEDRGRRDLRVDTEKLDKLFALVGELITAESFLAHCPDLPAKRPTRLGKALDSLGKITREIEETTMSIRMVPLESLFDRMERLARDTSRKLGKDIEFVVSGADKEMDKNAIEQLADPLSHLVRNAVDHGIEGARARQEAGKRERGRVELRAEYEGSDVLISVSDDGSGLDGRAVLRTAQEKGLAKAGEESVDDERIRELVFTPGFSTSKEITEVSGRGVGLDVVKRNVEKLRGRIELDWKQGEGATFSLRIPLTMAIIDAMVLRSGRYGFAIPMVEIREFFRPEASQLVRAGGARLALRGEFLPLFRLEDLLGHGPRSEASPSLGGKVAVVLERDGRRICLAVDQVVGAQQVVVKPLPLLMGVAEGLSGCCVMGDGSVIFIVDTGQAMAMAVEDANGSWN